MKYLFSLAGIFDTDPITTGSVGGSATTPTTPTTPATGSCGDLCHDLGNGMPKYVKPVLDDLLGNGTISRTAYKAVCSGAKSIEDLDIGPAMLVRLRCDGTGDAEVYDSHFDPTHPPAISSVLSGLTVGFAAGHRPTDKVHRITVNAGGNPVAAGSTIAHVTFSAPFLDSTGQEVAPNVMITGAGGTHTWRAANIYASGYDVVSDSGIAANTSGIGLQVVATPARAA